LAATVLTVAAENAVVTATPSGIGVLAGRVAGEIVETNANLEDAPQAINEDPYGQFVFVVELDAPFEKGDLLDATEYAAICEE
jgi:glycine cleavage system H protein